MGAENQWLEEVINDLGTAYFNNTVSWAVAESVLIELATIRVTVYCPAEVYV